MLNYKTLEEIPSSLFEVCLYNDSIIQYMQADAEIITKEDKEYLKVKANAQEMTIEISSTAEKHPNYKKMKKNPQNIYAALTSEVGINDMNALLVYCTGSDEKGREKLLEESKKFYLAKKPQIKTVEDFEKAMKKAIRTHNTKYQDCLTVETYMLAQLNTSPVFKYEP